MQIILDLGQRSFKDIFSHNEDGTVNGQVIISFKDNDSISYIVKDDKTKDIDSGIITIEKKKLSISQTVESSSKTKKAEKTEETTKSTKTTKTTKTTRKAKTKQ